MIVQYSTSDVIEMANFGGSSFFKTFFINDVKIFLIDSLLIGHVLASSGGNYLAIYQKIPAYVGKSVLFL